MTCVRNLIVRARATALAFAASASALPAQSVGRLQLDLDCPAITGRLQRAAQVLGRHHQRGIGPVDGNGVFAPRAASGPLLAYLWLGLDEQARDVLRSEMAMAYTTGAITAGAAAALLAVAPATECGPPQIDDADAAGWIVVHHFWYLRATRDAVTVRSHLPLLTACAEHLAATQPCGNGRLDAAVLQLHAVACAAGTLQLLERIERPAAAAGVPPERPPVTAFEQRARALLLQFERRYWAATEGRFAVRAGPDGPLPGAADTANLMPCWIGMLATTGNKTSSNAVRSLRLLGDSRSGQRSRALGDTSPCLGQAMTLVALAQFDGAIDAVLDQLLQKIGTETAAEPVDLAATGAAIDAVLFALTGLRMATGPGIDEGWLRLHPVLPTGVCRLAVRGLRRDGWNADLWFERRDGPLTAAEAERFRRSGSDPELEVPDSAPRHLGALVLRQQTSAAQAGPRTRVVVRCDDRQFVTELGNGEVFEFASAVRPSRQLLGRAVSDATGSAAPRGR